MGFDGVPYDYSQTVNKGHGRVERRECWAITETDCLDYINPHGQWPQLNAAIKVVGHRETAAGAISQPRYYISSRAAPAGQLLAAVRSHWSIENSLHWTLDVTFREDQCRSAQGPRTTEPGHPASDLPQPAEKREHPESGHPRQTPQRRLA